MKLTRQHFRLCRQIRSRRVLRFADRFGLLNFGKRMALAKAEKTITEAFNLSTP